MLGKPRNSQNVERILLNFVSIYSFKHHEPHEFSTLLNSVREVLSCTNLIFRGVLGTFQDRCLALVAPVLTEGLHCNG